jgi:dihydroorotase-like cyclic amidohydrolase
MLVDNEATLEKIFSSTMLIAVHCEDETTVQNNLKKYKAEYGEDVPVTVHHLIRSEEACYISSKAVALAKNRGTFAYFSFIDCQRNGFVHKQNSIGTKENYRSLYTPFMVYQ